MTPTHAMTIHSHLWWQKEEIFLSVPLVRAYPVSRYALWESMDITQLQVTPMIDLNIPVRASPLSGFS